MKWKQGGPGAPRSLYSSLAKGFAFSRRAPLYNFSFFSWVRPSMINVAILIRFLITFRVHRGITSLLRKTTSLTYRPHSHPLGTIHDLYNYLFPFNSSSLPEFIEVSHVKNEKMTSLTYRPHPFHLGTIHDSCNDPHLIPHQIPSS
jgi:hypothetical protein